MATMLSADATAPTWRPMPITAEQVEAMLRAGVDGIDRAELIDGELIEMSPQYVPHLRAKSRLRDRLYEALKEIGSSLIVSEECSFLANMHNWPQPDIGVWEPVETQGALPAANVRLAVEICVSSHGLDLRRKPALYATAGIPEYWVFDMAAGNIVVMTRPEAGTYTSRHVLAFGAALGSVTLGIEVATGGLV